MDFDKEGFIEIFIGWGYLVDKAELIDNTTSYKVRPILLRNTGDGKLDDVSECCG